MIMIIIISQYISEHWRNKVLQDDRESKTTEEQREQENGRERERERIRKKECNISISYFTFHIYRYVLNSCRYQEESAQSGESVV